MVQYVTHGLAACKERLGVNVIAGVRARRLAEARTLGVSDTVAIDDDSAIAGRAMVDGVADTVGGETAAKLFSKVKNGGNFGYASVSPGEISKLNPTVTVTRVVGRPDASKVREERSCLCADRMAPDLCEAPR
jgi:NADPH:quinone reductase-like Zn-dependent oxidoreductase